jgi:hypothetical protein
MAKATAKTQVEGTSINADIKEGKALGSIWRQTNSLKQTIKANGFDTRLGKLMQKLKAQSSLDSGQISRQVLTTYGIHCIDRRRRSEALWFVENETEVRAFIETSGFKGSSLTALQAAMRKAAKGSDESAKAEQPAKAEPSNVGQSDEAPAKADKPPVTRQVMVKTIIRQCELNGLDLEKIIEDLMASLPTEAKVAA